MNQLHCLPASENKFRASLYLCLTVSSEDAFCIWQKHEMSFPFTIIVLFGNTGLCFCSLNNRVSFSQAWLRGNQGPGSGPFFRAATPGRGRCATTEEGERSPARCIHYGEPERGTRKPLLSFCKFCFEGAWRPNEGFDKPV